MAEKTLADTLGLQGVDLIQHGADGKVKLVPATAALQGKTVGLYFSAHWCPPCRAFTPVLAEVYRTVKHAHPDFEVVYVSGDRDESQAQEYYAEMPWLAVPFEAHAARRQLSSSYWVSSIPRLVIVGPEGQIISSDARSAVMADRSGQQYPWRGAATVGPSGLLGFLVSPRGMLLLFLVMYYLSQWLSKKSE